ncbi:protein O-glucosyltransferase 2-like [Eupeodes corollae]|uniref:protein O-glucosyltransferase 2-like n=1 Tax=Eupeodes corollae TaxID=290404 RepID=UPI0024926DE6|nr:protein O-glucosyltransferase 2-like [Eupeodes corollae]
MINYILLLLFVNCVNSETPIVDPEKTLVWGPGLKPDQIVLPVRYFFIQAVDKNGKNFDHSPQQQFLVNIKGSSPHGRCRSHVNIIDRGDGSSIVRYAIADWCDNMEIEIKYNGSQVAESPYYTRETTYSEKCNCPQDLNLWLMNNDCPRSDKQIEWDLHSFKRVNFSAIRDNLLKRYNMPSSVSLCHYVVKRQQIYRQCYGKYTGFKMFMDATLLSLARVAVLPDMEFYLNLGDWPLSKKGGQQRTSGPYPIFSWCGSDDSHDIVLPTYDLTESTLESMGRVSLDMLSVQRGSYPWESKEEKAFWRGRDSRRERLDLLDLARKHPDLINASITNFFFFRDEEEKYGPTVAHISFMDFFKYKYQLNIDGTVASYRFPYLLGGDALVFKQVSPFYEHFYSKLVAYKHYVPFKRDLSDLLEKIKWAKENDERAKEIAAAGRAFALEHLMPQNIFCYHLSLFKEWSTRLLSPIVVLPGMEKLEQTSKCTCKVPLKDEL